jgi:hydrogenase maturation protease
MKQVPDTLILGWGNPGRRDDGLGPEFVDSLKKLSLPRVELDSGYQLQVEDAAQISRYRRVVFVDADRQAGQAYWIETIHPSSGGLSFTTHHVAPDRLLALSRDLFHHQPEAWLLGIRGYEFDEFGEGLTHRAQKNLIKAIEFLEPVIRENRWRAIGNRSVSCRTARDQEGERCQIQNP